MNWFVKPENEDVWNEDDWGLAAILEARWLSLGVSEKDRRKLIPCAVWKKKHIGITFSESIMNRLKELEL